MSLLVETIKSEDGNLLNVAFHNKRIISTLFEIFGLKKDIDILKFIKIPEIAETGIFRCRVEYDYEIRKIEFIKYSIRPVVNLKIITNNEIDYCYKFANRSAIDRLMAEKGECDDIIIIKDGYVTDSSYANLIFKDPSAGWVTPTTYLLPGTRRASLLKSGLIKETCIKLGDIEKYTEVKLINAMIGIEDTEGIPINNIF